MVLQNSLLEKITELKIEQLQTTLQDISIQHWLNYELFTWQWWFKLILVTIALIMLFKLIDKKNLFKILTFGFIIGLIAITLDNIGINFVLWDYPIRFLPIEFFIFHDTILVPVTFMLIFQYFPKWDKFIIVQVLLSVFGAFIVEPFYVLIGIYKQITWQHIYSFIMYILIAIVCKFITDKLNDVYIKNQI